MTLGIGWDPALPWALVWAALALGLGAALVTAWRGLPGWWLRALGALALAAALAGPVLREEARDRLDDIVILATDASASNRIAGRDAATAAYADALAARIEAREGTDLRRVEVSDGEGDEGTRLMAALAEALGEVPADRVAGVIALTDGRAHDVPAAPEMPAPFHAILSGAPDDWDRRLTVTDAPAYAILGEEVTLTLRVEDEGAVPEGAGRRADVSVSVDGGAPFTVAVPVGEDIDVPVILPNAGRNVIRFATPDAPGELTARNNAAIVQMNGLRDRLRVLLVSGEPHPGGRTWRNLLKSDAGVDLVHFTILRPPGKQDGVPVDELSLIAFPTRELFMEKIEDFDLIIFDRYTLRGILPAIYLDNIRQYAEDGGAVLIAAGPGFGTAESIARSPLGEVLPGAPTGRVVEAPFRPAISDLGLRHPVTEGLGDPETWGRWYRTVETVPGPVEGDVVMTGADDLPLLTLARTGEGRVALLASDHAWLWARGHDGGGPQLELLRRLAHWLMGEPELEEESLTATAIGLDVTVVRRTLEDAAAPVAVTGPDGTETELPLEEVAPGRFEGRFTGPEIGLYRLTDGVREAVIGLGPAAPREFERTIAGGEDLAPVIEASGGGTYRMTDGLPRLRDVRAGRPASGRGWIGLTPREAYVTTDLRVTPLLPPWAWLLLAGALVVAAWLLEGRRRRAAP